MGCTLDKIFKPVGSSIIARIRKWREVDEIYEESYMESVNKSMFPIVKVKRWAISEKYGGVASETDVATGIQSDYEFESDLFTNGSITEFLNNSSSGTNESRNLWGQKLAYWTAPVSITIFALIVVCGLILCIEQRRRSYQRREENVEGPFQMMHINRPRRNTTPRASIAPTVRITSQENPERPTSQSNPPTDTVTSSEGAEADSQEVPKELLVTALKFEVVARDRSQLHETNERTSEIITFSSVTGFPRGWEKIKEKMFGKEMEKKVAGERAGGGFNQDEFLLKQQTPKAFNALA